MNSCLKWRIIAGMKAPIKPYSIIRIELKVNGMLECWNVGMMERWNDGMMEWCWAKQLALPPTADEWWNQAGACLRQTDLESCHSLKGWQWREVWDIQCVGFQLKIRVENATLCVNIFYMAKIPVFPGKSSIKIGIIALYYYIQILIYFPISKNKD